MIPVVGGPIEFVMTVAVVNGVLRLIATGVDECERLAQNRLLPSRTPYKDWLPGLRSVMEGTDNSGCVFKVYKENTKSPNVTATTANAGLPEKMPVGRKGLNTTATT